MYTHPEIGARLLSRPEFDDLRAWILAHHERPDGLGYPRGLSADEIPLEARILAVADAYEAMTADRVYRPALGEAAARAELEAGAGTQFDADVVAALPARARRGPRPPPAPRGLALRGRRHAGHPPPPAERAVAPTRRRRGCVDSRNSRLQPRRDW